MAKQPYMPVALLYCQMQNRPLSHCDVDAAAGEASGTAATRAAPARVAPRARRARVRMDMGHSPFEGPRRRWAPPRSSDHRCAVAVRPLCRAGRPARRGEDNEGMTTPRPVETWLTDMDGVLVHEEEPIAGAAEFVEALKSSGKPFLVLTNNSIFTPRDLRARLLRSGIDVPEEAIWTSALATADFLAEQRPGGSAFAVGEAGLTTALHDVGYVLTDRDPDYVVLGETRTYSFESITTAIRHIESGARFIATNPDPSGPSVNGTLPATGSVAALISTATGRKPYFVGKPNPLMMRSALNRLDAHSETTVMIGDRMDTDVVGGIEAGLRTLLVLTGSTSREAVEHFPYRPTRVLDSIADVVTLVEQPADEW